MPSWPPTRAQYRHFEAALPDVLEHVVARIDDPLARGLVQANLDDERGVPAPHLDLFEGFAAAVGAPDHAEADTGHRRAGGPVHAVADESPVAALAALAAYEVQASDIAASKADGLRARYGVTAAGTRFWDVHSGVDEVHGAWTGRGPGRPGAGRRRGAPRLDAAAAAWWAFLDDREAAAPVPPPAEPAPHPVSSSGGGPVSNLSPPGGARISQDPGAPTSS